VTPERIEAAAGALRAAAGGELDCAIVLGSGFSTDVPALVAGSEIPYHAIEGMPLPTVAGHAGTAYAGALHGRRVVAFSGRFHPYEGRTADEVAYPIVVAARAGARTFVLTNAAGALNPAYRCGDVMLIADQINLTGTSPLIGRALLPGVDARFIDMNDAYAQALRRVARRVAGAHDVVLREGVYAGVLGPAYETPAEVRYLRTIGADAVGMSTVLEAIAARALRRDVVGLSLIANVHGAGTPISHDEVLAAARRGEQHLARLVEGIVATLEPVR
jgi:purine-nucleoside phosphorylase